MPTYYARKTGNINATDVWATTPTGTAGAVTFASGDVLMANSFTITVNVSTNLGSTGQVRNDTTGGATAGGGFTLSSGVTLTANVFAGSASCVGLNGGTFTIYGNINGGTGTSSGGVGSFNGTNTLSVFGNVVGGNGNTAAGIFCLSSTLNLNIEGNVTGGSGNQSSGITYNNTGFGNITVIGNVTGGTSSSASGITTNLTSNNVTVTGIVTGGTTTTNFGCSVLGVLTINGLAVGGTAGPGVSPGTAVTATRAVGNGFGLGSIGLTAAPGISQSGTSVVEVSELEYGLRGMPPVVGIVRLKKVSSNAVIFNWVDSGAAKTLVDATQGQMPAVSNVRSGVSYASGALVGTCAVPSPATVATGVPVDNTVGTAALSASDVATAVWGAASRTITGGLVDTATTLTNAPSVPTPAQIATQVRTELGTELGRIDANISSRLAPSGTLATVTNLTNAPSVPSAAQIASQVRTELATELARVDVATSSRLAAADYNAPTSAPTAASVANAVWSAAARTITGGTVDTLTNAPTVPSAAAIATQVWAVADKTGYSLTSAERNAIAAAVEASLLNEGDGQAILNAIVTAIGNSNVDQVALVAAIRSDLERNGGKLDGVPAAVRSNLATELGRIDAEISTRLAGSAYNAPANSDIAAIKSKTDALPASPAATGDIPSANIAAIKAKTDLLNTDRLAQCSTVSTTGAQLAAALS